MSSGDIDIKPLRGRRALGDWLDVPSIAYAGDPNFIAPLRLVERERISPRHNPFFSYGDAEMFVAYRNGAPAGRISAQINRKHLAHSADDTGHFGFFDCIQDDAVASKLIETASAWLSARGLTRMRGPFNLTVNQDIGLLVDGFESAPAILTSHAAPWSGGLLEASGLAKAMDLFAFRMNPNSLPREIERLAKFAKDSNRVRVRQVRMDTFADEARLVFDIFNDAWSHNWGFEPVTEPDIKAMIRDIRPIMRSKFGWIAEIDGEPAAMMMVLPDINRVVSGFGGHLLPFNWAKLAYEIYADRWETARVPLLGIRRRYRDSILAPAVLSLLVSNIVELGQGYDIDWIEFSWILETNGPMVHLATLAAGPPARTYRVYEKALSSSET
jgi:hypothetical protein